MGKNKLKKFAEIESFSCVYQYPREKLLSVGFPYSGKWKGEIFKNENPIVLELGCGKGEYTVGLAVSDPQTNFIGIDIKGARIWSGAKEVETKEIKNAAFLRTEIENIDKFFAPDEVSEIWITFPDPQMQKARKRLVSSRFLKLYSSLLKDGGIINLKTDSPFLFEYTRRLVELNGLEVLRMTDDLYGSGEADEESSIKTYYEQQWLSRGKRIKLVSFRLPHGLEIVEPEASDIPKDDYRAYPRHTVTLMNQD